MEMDMNRNKIPTTDNKLEAALAYISRGWAVFPLAPESKIPNKGSRSFKDSSTEYLKVRGWWEKNPAANIGIATGKISGLFVVDLDDAEAGIEAWNKLCEQHAQHEIETLQSLTVSGGRHLLFQYPLGDLNLGCSTKVSPHIHTRGNGGYIVAPPSYAITDTHAGPYAWLNPGAPISEMPLWLISIFQKPVTPITPQAGTIIPVGRRHDSIMRSVRGYAENTRYFIHLWNRAVGLVQKSISPNPEDPVTVGQLFEICLWAWNITHTNEQFEKAAAWKMLAGRAKLRGDIAFGEWGDEIHTLFITTSQTLKQHNNTNTTTTQSD